MKVVALLGEPATGKSTLARALLARLSPGLFFKHGLVVGTLHHREDVRVLGLYPDGHPFPGTDLLSLAAAPAVLQYLRELSERRPSASVFFEGDRLASKKLLDAVAAFAELRVFILSASDEDLRSRHKSRADSQSDSFLKGRRTKVRRLAEAFPGSILLSSSASGPADRLVERIRGEFPLSTLPNS